MKNQSISSKMYIKATEVQLVSDKLSDAVVLPKSFFVLISDDNHCVSVNEFTNYHFRDLCDCSEYELEEVSDTFLRLFLLRYAMKCSLVESSHQVYLSTYSESLPIDWGIKLFDFDVELHLMVFGKSTIKKLFNDPTLFYQSKYIDCEASVRQRSLDMLMGYLGSGKNEISIDLDINKSGEVTNA